MIDRSEERTRGPVPAPSPRSLAHLRDFLGLYLHDPAVGILRALEADLVSACPLEAPLLDLGCGDGTFGARAVRGQIAVGLDRNLARARAARATGAYQAVVVADAHRLPFKDGAFAAVLSNSTLEHIPGVETVLHEAARVLRPDGELLFSLHNDRFAHSMFFWPRLFGLLGLPGLTERYRRVRLRRLAMVNLLAADEWRSVLDASGLETTRVVGYLSGRAEAAFEVLLVVARLGIGRANLGALLRVGSRALAGLGIDVHHRIAGRVLARLLADAARDTSGEPAAILISARRPEAGAVALAARRLPAVVELARFRATGSRARS